jgi:Nif-specific regulatory protein
VSNDARLQRLIAISESLMTARDRGEVVSLVLESGAEVFDAEGCSLALVDHAAKELNFVAMAGAASTAPFRIPLGRGIAGAVVASGEAVVVRDTSCDPRFLSTVDARTGFETRNLTCVPIRRRDEVVGVMQVLNARQEFGDDDVGLLSAFANLAGAALNRAADTARRDVHEEVRQAAADERYHLVASKSETMRQVLRTIRTAARSAATVLLLGESGTGKEILARTLHRQSPRRERPFVAVNCTALTPTLLESELFGHEKGAFTGATASKKGKFELADGGTLFLDEIGDMAPEQQTKLLRVLQEREVERVGGSETLRVDVRVVAATNRDLAAAMRDGSFREDLYYRLAVVTVAIPPLRARREDVPDLCTHFLMRACRAIKRPSMRLSADAEGVLRAYRWPGNVRELANVIERAVVLSESRMVTLSDLPADIARAAPMMDSPNAGDALSSSPASDGADDRVGRKPLTDLVRDFKRDVIQEALRLADGNQTRAADLLDVHQSNLSRMMRVLGLR